MKASGGNGSHIATDLGFTNMIVVYLSPVNWDSIAQRPHFFADFIADHDVEKVIWVDPLPSRFPKYSDIRTKIVGVESKSISKHANIDFIRVGNVVPIEPFNLLYKVVNWVTIHRFIKRLKSIINGQQAMLVVGKPSVLGLELIRCMAFNHIVADAMDDYPHFFTGYAEKSVARLFRKLLGNTDITMFSSEGLLNKFGNNASRAYLVRNACSKSFYSTIQRIKGEQQESTDKPVTYGYIGSVAKWFDWEFITKLSESRPNAKVVIVGPLYVRPDYIPDNVVIKPAIDHKDVPALINSFTYGLIPFRINELTESVDPVKYYEYVAAGIPVITTRFGEMTSRVDSGFAVTLEQHLAGVEPVVEKPIFWEDRFSILTEELFGIKRS